MTTIAVFHPSSDLYGSDRILVNALGAMPTHIHKKVYLLSHGPLVDFLQEKTENVEVIICPNMPVIYRKIFTVKGIFIFLITWLRFFVFMRKQKKQYQFESVYVNTLSNTFILPILAALRLKRFVHVHEIVVRPKLIGKITAFLAANFANNILCVSVAVANNLKTYSKKASQKIVVIHNGIERIMTTEKEQSTILSFCLFGRIMPQKGQWLVVEALSKIPIEKLKHTRFTFMGGVLYNQTSILNDLESKVNQANLGHIIEFKEFAPNISDAMSEADICLVPSTILDSFPTTVLEAMSAKKLVIATNQGGAKEAVKDKQTGLLFDHNNAADLAKKIQWVIDNPQVVSRMGLEAKMHFQQHFTLKIFNKTWHNFIAENQYI